MPVSPIASQRTNLPSWMCTACVAQVSKPSNTWVTFKTVAPSFRKKAKILWRANTSKSAVASSRKTTSLRSRSLRPNSSFRRSPSESIPNLRVNNCFNPSASCNCSSRGSRVAPPASPRAFGSCKPSNSHTFMTATLSSPAPSMPRQPPCTNEIREPAELRNGSWPCTFTCPAGAILLPANTSSMVDLPAPLAPTTTQRAPMGSAKRKS
mmetsp:Transcript_973/g.2022  ORF Transcript_973/g.2022 Transcript_973/m.2022 type:complete len:209 (-) Transcript_973:13-639(-)